MNPALIIGLVTGAAVVYALARTVNTAVKLTWNVTRFGIYQCQFTTGGNLVLRLRLRIGNPTNTPITINFIDVSAYLDPEYNTVDGRLQVQNRGYYIASLTETVGIVIQPNAVTERDFFINIRWTDIAKYLAINLTTIISQIRTSQGINEIVSTLMAHPVLLQGNIKAENVNFPIEKVFSLTDDRQ